METKDRSKEPTGEEKVVAQKVEETKVEVPEKPKPPKGTLAFKEVIKNHLRTLAKNDPLFMATLRKPNKDINDCITYIVNQVQASGSFGFPDSEIFQMAVHYYDEDNIEVGKPISDVHIVNNHAVQLTEEEIAKAKAKAKEKVIDAEMARMRKKPTKAPDSMPKSAIEAIAKAKENDQARTETKKVETTGQPTLF